MNVVFLEDLERCNGIGGVFITESTTKEEIEDVINKVKNEVEGEYSLEDVKEKLSDEGYDDVDYYSVLHNNVVTL